MDITIKDKVKFNYQGNEQRYIKYNGFEATVIKDNGRENGGRYRYFLYFYDKDIQEMYTKDGGGLYLHSEWIEKIGTDEERYNEYLELEKEKEEKAKYAWGKCEKCGGPLDMYYRKWCPQCEKPEIKLVKELNFFTMAKYLDIHGRPGIKDRLWDWLDGRNDVHNDVTIDFYLVPEEMENEELKDDIIAIKETWHIEEDSIKMEISW